MIDRWAQPARPLPHEASVPPGPEPPHLRPVPHNSSVEVPSDQPRSAQHGTTNGTTAMLRGCALRGKLGERAVKADRLNPVAAQERSRADTRPPFAQFGYSAVPGRSGGWCLRPMELSAENRERSSCVGNVCGSGPTPARRGLRASASVGRGGGPRRGHLRHARLSGLPSGRPRVPPLRHRCCRVPASGPLPACGSLRQLRPGTGVLARASSELGHIIRLQCALDG